MRKEMKYIQVAAFVIVSLVYLGVRALPFASSQNGANMVSTKDGFYHVERVVDGDTLKLSGRQRVRLIGIDTPEVHYSQKLFKDAKRSHSEIKTIQALGKKASDFTKKLCFGRKVRLEFDVEKRDRYGRLLAYVYLEDGTFVNAKIIEEGFAQVMTVPPNVRYSDYFLKLQKEARESGRGLWGMKDGLR